MCRSTENMNSAPPLKPRAIKKHISKLGIKAVTFHQMEILKEPSFIVVKFILNINSQQSKACLSLELKTDFCLTNFI
jgi:hypothetical protein